MRIYEEKFADYVEMLKMSLSKKRFTHSMNVADLSCRFADHHGGDTEKAYLAGLLHDIKKEETPQAMKSFAILSRMDFSREEEMTPALWHAPAGAYYIKKYLGITDTDILNAVRYHTAGRENMSLLEKVVYLGDLTSADRGYKDVEKYRALAYADLDDAMFFALRYSIGETVGKYGFLPPCTIKGYNYYAEKFRRRYNEDERKKFKL